MNDTPRRIRIAHSPDADDAFMFWGLASGRVGAPGFVFEHVLKDIETLNQAALRGEYEVTAVSIHAWPRISDRYLLMPCGASMGEGYGPVVVAKRKLANLRGKRVAIPGPLTSAALALQLWEPEAIPVALPFDRIGEAVLAGEVDAGVIIHEGQLTWQEEGLVKVVDLGEWWAESQDGLPLPLGGNAIRRDLGPETIQTVTRVVHESIALGLKERRPALDHALSYARGLPRERADRFVGMYVNDRTLDYGADGREAIRRFLALGQARGLVAPDARLDVVELEPRRPQRPRVQSQVTA